MHKRPLEGLGLLVVAVLIGSGCVAAVGNRGGTQSSPRIEPPAPGYRIEAVRLQGGGWDLLRYRPDTGQAWYSTGDRWIPIVDPEEVPASEYSFQPVVYEPKSWSVVRLDTRTGRSWVARNSTWVEIVD